MTVELQANLDNLPDDVLGIIFRQLDLDELIRLRSVGKNLSERVISLGIPLYASSHRQSHLTISPSYSSWSPLDLVKYNHYINQSLHQHRFHSLQIGSTWFKSVIPTLELTKDKIIVGVGNKVLIHPLIHHNDTQDENRAGKIIDIPIEYDLNQIPNKKKGDYQGGKSDIIGIIPLSNSYLLNEDEYIIAQFDGTIQKVNLSNSQDGKSIIKPKAKYSNLNNKESINTIIGTSDGNRFMTTSISGKVNLYSTKSPWLNPSSIQLKTNRAWSSLLSDDSYGNSVGSSALLGIQGGIEIYPIYPSSGLSQSGKPRKLIGPEEPLLSSPYDLQLPPISSKGEMLSSHNPNLLLSGWYDSHLRIHDLRLSQPTPILEFSDPYSWADGSAFYSTAFIGEYHLGGGGSKHGTVSLFDIRNNKSYLDHSSRSNNNDHGIYRKEKKVGKGWSSFSPGGKNSPVYKLKSDNGKIYGVTEKRLFIMSFDESGNYDQGLITNRLKESMNTNMNRNRNNNNNDRYKSYPSSWKGRGGKWNWTVNYNKEESKGSVGYEHTNKGVELFDSLIAV